MKLHCWLESGSGMGMWKCMFCKSLLYSNTRPINTAPPFWETDNAKKYVWIRNNEGWCQTAMPIDCDESQVTEVMES